MPKTLFHFNPNTVKESSLEFKRVASCDDDTYLLSKFLASCQKLAWFLDRSTAHLPQYVPFQI